MLSWPQKGGQRTLKWFQHICSTAYKSRSIKIFETQGASNILVKTEEFDTQKGITGRKAYGTLSMVDKVSGKSTKMYYEILIFAQSNGIQQITILQREDDQYAKKIGERMLNSVELKVAE